MSDIHTSYQVRFDWDEVDVLSFTTAVSVAVERGAIVFPYRWADNSAISFTQTKNATLLGKRDENGLSLSPLSLMTEQSSPARMPESSKVNEISHLRWSTILALSNEARNT